MWEHSSSLPNRSYDRSEAQSLAESGAEPFLVRELALWQLRSLPEGVSLASSVLEAAASVGAVEQFDVVVDGKPSQIPTSDWLSQSPTQSPRRPLKTSSSSGFGQLRAVSEHIPTEGDDTK